MNSSQNNPQADSVTTISAVLHIAFRDPLSHEQLEDVAVRMQKVLDAHTVRFADGASASANFVTSEVEVDLSLVGDSMSAMHEMIAGVIRALELHCGIEPSGLSSSGREVGAPSAMAIRSSETQLVPA